MDKGHEPEEKTERANRNCFLNGSTTGPCDGLDKTEGDEQLLDDEVRRIFSLTNENLETVRKKNSLDVHLLEAELKDLSFYSKEDNLQNCDDKQRSTSQTRSTRFASDKTDPEQENAEERRVLEDSKQIPSITINLSNITNDECAQITAEKLKTATTPCSSRSITPRVVKRSYSFQEIKNYFEEKSKQVENAEEETSHVTQNEKEFEEISSTQDSESENKSATTDSDESNSFSSEISDEIESDTEALPVPELLNVHIERLLLAEQSYSDTDSDASSSSDAVLNRTKKKVLKKLIQKYAFKASACSDSEENSEDNDDANVCQRRRSKEKANYDLTAVSTEGNSEVSEELSSRSNSSCSEWDYSESDGAEINDSSNEDCSDTKTNFDFKESFSKGKEIPGLEMGDTPQCLDDLNSPSETDESVTYRSYNLENQSGSSLIYHEEVEPSRAKNSVSLKDARSLSLPNFVAYNKLEKLHSFEEKAEINTGHASPNSEMPTTLKEDSVSDLRWPFSNLYVKEVQEDVEEPSSTGTKTHAHSEVFPCYKSKTVSSSFPGRKKDIMLGRVWWVEWWAENESPKESDQEIISERQEDDITEF